MNLYGCMFAYKPRSWFMVCIIVVQGWESSSLMVVVSSNTSVSVSVGLGGEVCKIRVKESVQVGLLVFLTSGLSFVVVLPHLEIYFIIVDSLVFDHSREWLHVWSSIGFIGHMAPVCFPMSKDKSSDETANTSPFAKVIFGIGVWTDVGPLNHISHMWNYSDTSSVRSEFSHLDG